MKRKTGAIVCMQHGHEKKIIYQAVLFITNIPEEVTDDDLEENVDFENLIFDRSGCVELLFRADIHSTSNEVQEQFYNLHLMDKPVPALSYDKILEKSQDKK